MDSSPANDYDPSICIRTPGQSDAADIYRLVDECKPLDLNSLYAYLLVSTHFSDTSAVADREGELVGFLSGYMQPAKPDTLFFWQIAVSRRARGQGLAKRMLQDVLTRPASRRARFIETTINPSNTPSWALFRSLAEELGSPVEDEPLFGARDFGQEEHEAERLLRIGPFSS